MKRRTTSFCKTFNSHSRVSYQYTVAGGEFQDLETIDCTA